MGWNGPACYGSDLHRTPNLDRLAASGMKFTSAYAACTVCSPGQRVHVACSSSTDTVCKPIVDNCDT